MTTDATLAGVSEDGTQTTNTDAPAKDEPRQLTPRELAMEAIKPDRDGHEDADQVDAVAIAREQLEVQTHDPGPKTLESDLDKVMVKVKIDGVESEVSVEEMTRQYQKNGAADKRLAEATRLLEQVRHQAAQPPVGIAAPATTDDSTGAPTDGVDQQGGKAFLAALFDGDEDRALEALGKVLGGRQQPTLDEHQLVAKLAPQIRQQLVVDNALDQFGKDFADVMADPYLEQIAADATEAEMATGKPFTEALVAGGKKARDWLASKGVKTTPNQTPTMDRTTKLGRKAEMDVIPALSKTATTTQELEQSRSDVIAEMRKARGAQ